jgi:arylsulfatase A-like enzyme
MTPWVRKKVDLEHNRDPERIRGTIAAYHATIAHVDAMVGRILDALAESGHAERTVVIFTSDHGEMLGDHGILHKGPIFYEGAVRVPLIYRFPDRFGLVGVDEGFTSHVDLAATVAELAAVDPPRLHQGVPLFGRDEAGTLVCRPVPPRSAAVCEWRGTNTGAGDPGRPGIRCLVTEEWKYVHYEGEEGGELYDRRNDPEEFHNLYADPAHGETVAAMRQRLLDFTLETEPVPPRTDCF